MHRDSVILFERVTVMAAMALIHLFFDGDSTLSYVKNKLQLKRKHIEGCFNTKLLLCA